MKKLEDKVKRHEEKAKRTLARRQAVKLSKQAAKFRQDSFEAGIRVSAMGAKIYGTDHPIYEDLIAPLLKEAAEIAAKYGFDVLYQTRTPIPGSPNYTACMGSFAKNDDLTPTMKGCIDLIKQRPHLGGDEIGEFKCQPEPEDSGVHCTAHVDYDPASKIQ